jgi:poly(3-hydroxybutyrate) depolymerase
MVRRPSRLARVAVLAVLVGAAACELPSERVDPTDLRGGFDRVDAGPMPSGSAAASAKPAPTPSASAAVTLVERDPNPAGCVEPRAEPRAVRRTAGRPACRAAEVMELRDPGGHPRYACLYSPPGHASRGPLPLVVFFHGTGPSVDEPSAVAKLTKLRDWMTSFTWPGSETKGFHVLGVQGRALEGSDALVFDVAHTTEDAPDVWTTNQFVDRVVERGIVDPKRVYALGMGSGGRMAAAWAMQRTDRVAAFASFGATAPEVAWRCPGPPPPGLLVYRACDSVAPCDQVEQWIAARREARAETKTLRLGEDLREEPACAVRNACTPKKALAAHHRWPKGREADVLGFFAEHALR